MKKSCIWLFLGCAALLFLSGCTSQLFVSRTMPPEVAVAYDQWKVMVINRYNTELLPYDREKKVDVFKMGAQQAFHGAIDAIFRDSTYVLVHSDSLSYRLNEPKTPLTPEEVQRIHQQHPHHLLLSLEDFEILMNQETERIKDEAGNVSKTAYYTLVTRSHWALYDSTGRELDRYTTVLEEPYQSRSVISGLLAVGPALSNAGPTVNLLAWFTGAVYWNRLSPQPVNYSRPYYSQKNLQAAGAMIATENWEAAIALLKPIAEGGGKDSAKAAYNLAVIYEAMGQKQESLYWAQEAKRKNNRLALIVYQNL